MLQQLPKIDPRHVSPAAAPQLPSVDTGSEAGVWLACGVALGLLGGVSEFCDN